MVVGFIDKLVGMRHFDCFLVSKLVFQARVWSEASQVRPMYVLDSIE